MRAKEGSCHSQASESSSHSSHLDKRWSTMPACPEIRYMSPQEEYKCQGSGLGTQRCSVCDYRLSMLGYCLEISEGFYDVACLRMWSSLQSPQLSCFFTQLADQRNYEVDILISFQKYFNSYCHIIQHTHFSPFRINRYKMTHVHAKVVSL